MRAKLQGPEFFRILSDASSFCLLKLLESVLNNKKSRSIGHVNNIPTMQFFSGISIKTCMLSTELVMLSLTESVWEFQNNALWDTHH